MQTDPNLALQIKLTDHVPIHEIEIETEAKAPNVLCRTLVKLRHFLKNSNQRAMTNSSLN